MSSSQRRRNRMRWWFEQMRAAVEGGSSAEPCADRFSAAIGGSTTGGRFAPQSGRLERQWYEYDI